MSDTRKYYVLPVRDMVMFPGIIAPLFVGRPRSLKAMELAVLQERTLVIVAQKDAKVDDPKPQDLFSVGTLCNVLQMVRVPDGSTKVLVEGVERIEIVSYSQKEDVLEAEVSGIASAEELTEHIEALKRSVLEQFEKYVTLHPKLPSEILMSVMAVKDPFQVADLVASHIIVDIDRKQKLLEINSIDECLEMLLKILLGEVDILELEHQIHDKVQKELEQGQRQYYLREQLKVIQDELGQGETDPEIAEIRNKIDKVAMPPEVEKKARHELTRLSKMPVMSAEATVARTYLDWLIGMPWQSESADRLDIDAARRVLNADHYGLEKVKERLTEFLAVRKLAGEAVRGQVLCLVGPPGVGKTSLARSIAHALNREFVSMSLGGIKDEAEIRGHRRTYIGALPGRVVQKLHQAGTKNPVLLMDEIDKMGADFRGDPSAALLEVLDPEQNSHFSDHFLEVSFDLSHVMFITTANVTHTIPKALLDRMEVIRIPGYEAEEKTKIARRHLLPKLLKEHGLKRNSFNITPKALERVVRDYTMEAGVRNLERQLAQICRKAALHLVEKFEAREDVASIRVGVRELKEYLGPPKRYDLSLPREKQKGIAVGLAWTEVGGEVLVIEASTARGKGVITLTGNLGTIMQESAQTALGYLRSNSDSLGLDVDWEALDIHLHVPEGAIPKDGPSAGITMAVAILSAISGRRSLPNIAMTGEISLLGQVLPIGGVREKILAAKRNRIKKLIVPLANQQDVEELPSWAVKGLSFVYVGNITEVLGNALEGTSP